MEPSARRNAVLLCLDVGLFHVGLAFASQHTILPAFALHLGASNVVIGAIPAVMAAGFFLPSAFVAGHTQALSRKLPFVLRFTIWERVPFLALAAVAFWLADRAPGLALACLLGLLLVTTGIGGVLMPAWMDLVGRTVPTTARGRFFAAGNLLGGAGGVLAGFATTYLLGALAPPASYGVCFLGGAVVLGLSYLALARVEEPGAVETALPAPFRTYLTRIPALLRRDRNFSRFLVARGLGIAGTMATGFYTVFALRALGAADRHVGLFTTILWAAQLAGAPVLGWLADRAGHRLPLIAGLVASVAANLVALVAPSLPVYCGAFALAGLHLGATQVSGHAVLLEFAPTVGERPSYVGIGNTALGPVTLLAPLGAGLLADALGIPAVFIAAAAFGLAGLALFVTRVGDPRHPAAR